MNRIILIGNGFDLAHGLPTSYKDFIDDYWTNKVIKLKRTIHFVNEENDPFEIFNFSVNGFYFNPQLKESYYELIKLIEENGGNFRFKNQFLKIITEKCGIQNWVDVENEYYELLKDCIEGKKYYKDVDELNKDFDRIKSLLKDYLRKISQQEIPIRYNIRNHIYKPFFCSEITKLGLKKLDENENIKLPGKEPVYPETICFLNFNYTNTQEPYLDQSDFELDEHINTKVIHIHRKLDDDSIIFGYGDEIGEDYAKIENLNDNKYLENMKSIKYLETMDYRKLLDFINDGLYQIYIFGHSCGNSDRTLLNTLFEHENCVSIKPFFHQREDGTDNYTDIVMNISRHFSSKAMMRDKVVNRELCEPLL
ncbi:AbiH family protein [Dysgonomonas sp. 25]|uniref:AbiH family protein n=1 Tax=Dysgonomonas sp. 25 TaxID=2302933 RepID=UPI0013CF795F|nr:AbiH family protein [Dysgonomonas sp. 25]NDV69460.1 hypothetical protein [Dysgonomonas sp. 25]